MAINAAGGSGRRSIAAFAIRGGFGDSPNGHDGNPHDNVIFREPFAFRGAGWLRLPPLEGAKFSYVLSSSPAIHMV